MNSRSQLGLLALLSRSILQAHSATSSDGAIAKGTVLEGRVGKYWADAAPLIKEKYADRAACDASQPEICALIWETLGASFKANSEEHRLWQLGKPPRKGSAADDAASDGEKADYVSARLQRNRLQMHVSKIYSRMKVQVYDPLPPADDDEEEEDTSPDFFPPVGDAARQRVGLKPELEHLYKTINRVTGALGGNSSGGAINGELTKTSLNNVVDMLVEKAGLSSDDLILDLGSGMGKPSQHFAVSPACWSVGIEYMVDRYYLSLANLMATFNSESGEFPSRRNCVFVHNDGIELSSFDPFSIVYMFDVGMPPLFLEHVAACLKNSSVKWVLCYHSLATMLGYGYELEAVPGSNVTCSMHGSFEGKTARLFRCTHPPPAAPGTQVTAFIGGQEVRCDPVFQEAIGVLNAGTAKEHTSALLTTWANSDPGSRASASSGASRWSRWTSSGEDGEDAEGQTGGEDGEDAEGQTTSPAYRGWAYEPVDFTRDRPKKKSKPGDLTAAGRVHAESSPAALEMGLKKAMSAAAWAAFVAHMRL